MHSSIVNQFKRAVLITALLVIVLLTLSAASIGYHHLQQQAHDHLKSIADLTVVQAQAPVLFEDKQNATELLQAIPDTSGIQHAELRNSHGDILAYYTHYVGTPGKITSWLGVQTVSRDIVADGRVIGHLILVGSNGPLVDAMLRLFFSDILIATLIAILSAMIAARYTRRIAQPLDQLRRLMRTVIERGDFSQRAPTFSLLEAEELRVEFNALLDEIVRRDHELKQANTTLSHMAFRDMLTGLPNRAMFEQALEQARQASDASGAHIALLYADVDDFKGINDRYGHAVGDQFLAALGQRLNKWRPANALAARMGGDEFVVLIAPLSDTQSVPELVAQLRAAVEIPFRFDSQLLHPLLSIGVALYPQTPADNLIRAADRSMYVEKMQRRSARKSSSPVGETTCQNPKEPS